MTGTSSPEPVSLGQDVTPIAELVGYGRLTWGEFRRMLGDAEAAWADYDGFHVGRAPAEPPPYTHLWAWTSQWLIRARIDGDQVIAGALILDAPPAGAPAPQIAEKVGYKPVTARTWDAHEKRVGPVPTDLGDRAVAAYLIPGERPVTFISMARPSDARSDEVGGPDPEGDDARQ